MFQLYKKTKARSYKLAGKLIFIHNLSYKKYNRYRRNQVHFGSSNVSNGLYVKSKSFKTVLKSQSNGI